MRWSWLRAAILGLLIGPAPLLADASERDLADGEEPISLKRSGHVLSGPNFHVWDEDWRAAAGWAAELVQAGADRSELARWRGIAAASAAQPSILTDELEAELASRSSASAGELGTSTLGCVLCLLPSLDRTCLIAAWATSSSEPTRRALARALSAPFDAVGVRSAIAQLRSDPSREVRRLARAAALTRTGARS